MQKSGSGKAPRRKITRFFWTLSAPRRAVKTWAILKCQSSKGDKCEKNIYFFNDIFSLVTWISEEKSREPWNCSHLWWFQLPKLRASKHSILSKLEANEMSTYHFEPISRAYINRCNAITRTASVCWEVMDADEKGLCRGFLLHQDMRKRKGVRQILWNRRKQPISSWSVI